MSSLRLHLQAVIARGGRFLEAPVIGSKTPAQNGELVILSAGDISLHEDCFSCFQAIGKKTLYLGKDVSCSKLISESIKSQTSPKMSTKNLVLGAFRFEAMPLILWILHANVAMLPFHFT